MAPPAGLGHGRRRGRRPAPCRSRPGCGASPTRPGVDQQEHLHGGSEATPGPPTIWSDSAGWRAAWLRHERGRVREADPGPGRAREARGRQHPRPQRQADPRRVRQLRRRDGAAARRRRRAAARSPWSRWRRTTRSAGLRTALAMGAAKAILVSDDALSGAGALDTAKVLAKAIERAERRPGPRPPPSRPTATRAPCPSRSPRCWAGRRSRSPSTSRSTASTVKVQRQTELGYDEVEAPLPAVVSVTAGVVEPRYPSFKGIMAAKSKPVDQLTARRPGHRRRARSARPAPARRSWRSTTRPPARPARSSRTTARATPRSSPSSRTSRSSEASDAPARTRGDD